MRRLFRRLPGPAAVRVLILAGLAIAALVLLFLLFEYGGDFLDNGGVVG